MKMSFFPMPRRARAAAVACLTLAAAGCGMVPASLQVADGEDGKSQAAALEAALAGPGTASATVVTPAAARAAREAWMEQVRALRIVANAIRLSPERYHAIFGELEAAEAKAAKRGRPAAVQVTVDPGAKPGA